MKTVLIKNKEVFIYEKDEEISKKHKVINIIYVFKRQDAYSIGLKSKDGLVKILKENKIFAKSFINEPQNPDYIAWSFNSFDDREDRRCCVEHYRKEKPIWDSYPSDLVICI